jgi:hypothetical protein
MDRMKRESENTRKTRGGNWFLGEFISWGVSEFLDNQEYRVPKGYFENSPAFERRELDRITNESRRDLKILHICRRYCKDKK